MSDTIVSITGTDGKVPVYDPKERWCTWNLAQIYLGQAAEGRYVPKVKDYVVDVDLGLTYIVDSLDPITYVPRLREVTPVNSGGSMSEVDILFGVGPGTQSDTYRCYLDQSVTPHILAVDARLKIGGTMSSYVKIFRGADTSSSGRVVGFLIDQMGNMLTENIPLELAAIDSHTNHAIKTVSVAYTRDKLTDGEIVTAVVYNAEGHVVSKRQLLVENTAFIRNVSAGTKYISHISVESPFMSSSQDYLIEYPLNLPMSGIGLMGVVHYSDGSSIRLPVDGTKFRVYGLDQFVSTIINQRISLVIAYALSPNEAVYGAVSADGRYITEKYQLITVDPVGSYNVKLFGFPVWVDALVGYRLEWYLFNLDRNAIYFATPYVRINQNTTPFNPLNYGYLQRLSVTVNLKDISGVFKDYQHTQTIDITLRGPGTERQTNWTVGFTPDQSPPYGVDLRATTKVIDQNTAYLNISSGISAQLDWIANVYSNAKPLVDPQYETSAPLPNYFALRYGSQRIEYPIDQWASTFTLTTPVPLNSTLFIEFIRRTPTNDMFLGMGAMPVYEMP